MPKISVILSRGDHAGLGPTIESVLAQTVSDFEVILVGRTPLPREVEEANHDVRLRWHRCADDVLEKNAGLRLASGRDVAYLDAGDLWHPSHLARLSGALDKTDAGLVYSLLEIVGPAAGTRRLAGLDGQKEIPTSAMAHRREVWMQLGDWGQDDWAQRARRAGHRFAQVKALTAFTFAAEVPAERDRLQAEYLRRLRSDPDFIGQELIALVEANPPDCATPSEEDREISSLAELLRIEIARPRSASARVALPAAEPSPRPRLDQERFQKIEALFAAALAATATKTVRQKFLHRLNPRQRSYNRLAIELMTHLFEMCRDHSYDVHELRHKAGFQRDLAVAQQQNADRIEEIARRLDGFIG